MVLRGERRARNSWVKNTTPLNPAEPGKRLTARCTARLQVIPDAAFNQYGDRKITGVTLGELKTLYETGNPIIVKEGNRVTLRVEIGPSDYQWQKDEIGRIITETERDGVILLASPMGIDEKKEQALKTLMEPKPEGPTKAALLEAAEAKGLGAKSTLAKYNKAELQAMLEE